MELFPGMDQRIWLLLLDSASYCLDLLPPRFGSRIIHRLSTGTGQQKISVCLHPRLRGKLSRDRCIALFNIHARWLESNSWRTGTILCSSCSPSFFDFSQPFMDKEN